MSSPVLLNVTYPEPEISAFVIHTGPPGPSGPSGSGGVVGPGSSVDNQVALFDGTDGALLQASTIQHSSGNLVMPPSGTILFPDRATIAANPASGVQVYGHSHAPNFPQGLTWGSVLNNPRGMVPDPWNWDVGQIHSGYGTSTSSYIVTGMSGSLFMVIGYSVNNGTYGSTVTASATAATRRPRQTFATGTAINSSASLTSAPTFYRGAGMPGYLFLMYGVGSETINGGPQAVMGMSTVGYLTANPSARLNMAGMFGFDDTDTTWHLFHNDSAGAATKISLGIDFPLSTGAFYDFALYAPSDSTDVHWYARRLDTFIEASGTINSNLPLSSANLSAIFLVRNSVGVVQDIRFTGAYMMVPRERA